LDHYSIRKISTGTCSKWNKELESKIRELNNEKPERSLNALLMDAELAERLSQPNVIFLDEDSEEKMGHLETINSIVKRSAEDEEITDAMREPRMPYARSIRYIGGMG